MEKYRKIVESALRFTPERMEPLITNAHFRPYFVKDNGFVYLNERFDENNKKQKVWTAYDAASDAGTELFDHPAFAAALAEATGKEQDPWDLKISIERAAADGTVIIMLKDQSRYLWDGTSLTLLSPALPKGAVLSPDRTKAVVEEGGNLYLLTLPGLEKTPLTEDGAEFAGYGIRYPGSSGFIADKLKGVKQPAGVMWSPDGSRFLTYFMDYSEVGDYTLIQSVPDGENAVRPVVHTYRYALPGDKHVPTAMYYLYDLKEGAMKKIDTPVTYLSFGMPITPRVSMMGWSPRGDLAACYVMDRSFNKADVYLIDPASGKARKLFSETSATFLFFDGHVRLNSGSPEQEDYSAQIFPMSEKLNKLFWLSERSGQFEIYTYDLTDGTCHCLTEGDCCVRQLLHLDEEKGLLYYAASGREPGVNIYQRYIYAVDVNTGKIERLSRQNGDHNAFFPPAGDYFAAAVSAYDEPPTNRVIHIKDGTLKHVLSEADVSRLEAIGFTYPIPFCEKGADGEIDVFGVMFLPNHFDPTVKYPVIEYCYGGNQTTRVPQNFPETLNDLGFTPCFSEAGFVTVIADGRGTPLRGKKYHDYGFNNMGDCAGLSDRAAAIKALCKRYPFLDSSRVGVWGHSGGGFATLHAMVDHPELYKVGVSTGGNHAQEIYVSNWSERYMGPWDAEEWKAQNAEFNVDKLEGKLLMIHGELDDNVHPASTMRVVNALIKADKDFDMLIMPNMHHTLREHDYYRRRVLEYFLENL